MPVGRGELGTVVTFDKPRGYEGKAKTETTAQAGSDRNNSCFEVRIQEPASFVDNCSSGILPCNANFSAAIAESGTPPRLTSPPVRFSSMWKTARSAVGPTCSRSASTHDKSSWELARKSIV